MTHQLPIKPDPPVTSTVPFLLIVAPGPCAPPEGHQTYIKPSALSELHAAAPEPDLASAVHPARPGQGAAALEGRGFEVEAEVTGMAPGVFQFAPRRTASDLRILGPIFGARRIAEIVGMELRHDVHRRGGDLLGDPFQHRTGATRHVVR